MEALRWVLHEHAKWVERAESAQLLLQAPSAITTNSATTGSATPLASTPNNHAPLARSWDVHDTSVARQVEKQAVLMMNEADQYIAHPSSAGTLLPNERPSSAFTSSPRTARTHASSGTDTGIGSNHDIFGADRPIPLPLSHPAYLFLASQFFGAAATKDVLLAHDTAASYASFLRDKQLQSSVAQNAKAKFERIGQGQDEGHAHAQAQAQARTLELEDIPMLESDSDEESDMRTHSRRPSFGNEGVAAIDASAGDARGDWSTPRSTTSHVSHDAISRPLPGMSIEQHHAASATVTTANPITYSSSTFQASSPAASHMASTSAAAKMLGPTPSELNIHTDDSTECDATTKERIELASKYLYIQNLLEKMVNSAQTCYQQSLQVESLRKRLKPKRTRDLPQGEIDRMRATMEDRRIQLADTLNLFTKGRLMLCWMYADYNLNMARQLLVDCESACMEQRDLLSEKLNQLHLEHRSMARDEQRANQASQRLNESGAFAAGRPTTTRAHTTSVDRTVHRNPLKITETEGSSSSSSSSRSPAGSAMRSSPRTSQKELYSPGSHGSTDAQAVANDTSVESVLGRLDTLLAGMESRRNSIEAKLLANERYAISIAHYYLLYRARCDPDVGLAPTDLPGLSFRYYQLLDVRSKQGVTREDLHVALYRLATTLDTLNANIRARQMHNEELAGGSGGQTSNVLQGNRIKIEKLSQEQETIKQTLRDIHTYFLHAFVRNAFVNQSDEDIASLTSTGRIGAIHQGDVVKHIDPPALDARGLMSDIDTMRSTMQVFNPLDVANEGKVGPDEIIYSNIATQIQIQRSASTRTVSSPRRRQTVPVSAATSSSSTPRSQKSLSHADTSTTDVPVVATNASLAPAISAWSLNAAKPQLHHVARSELIESAYGGQHQRGVETSVLGVEGQEGVAHAHQSMAAERESDIEDAAQNAALARQIRPGALEGAKMQLSHVPIEQLEEKGGSVHRQEAKVQDETKKIPPLSTSPRSRLPSSGSGTDANSPLRHVDIERIESARNERVGVGRVTNKRATPIDEFRPLSSKTNVTEGVAAAATVPGPSPGAPIDPSKQSKETITHAEGQKAEKTELATSKKEPEETSYEDNPYII